MEILNNRLKRAFLAMDQKAAEDIVIEATRESGPAIETAGNLISETLLAIADTVKKHGTYPITHQY